MGFTCASVRINIAYYYTPAANMAIIRVDFNARCNPHCQLRFPRHLTCVQMSYLLAVDALRSDETDLEAATNPNPEASAAAATSPNPNLQTAAQPAAAAANMHRVTGTFADPSHESVFAAQFFRMAYPTHVLLMALNLAYFTWTALMEPDNPGMRPFWAAVVLGVAVGLACRVLLHRKHDPVRSQWIGSWAWTVVTTLNIAVGMVSFMVAPAAACRSALQAKYMVPFVMLLLVLINGTHGLASPASLG